MRRLVLLFVAVAAGAAAQTAAAQAVVSPVPAYRMEPGYGVVEGVKPVIVRERSAAAGGSSSEPRRTVDGRPAYRLTIRMPDGSVQYRDIDRPEFKAGEHVLLTNAGDVLPD